MRSVGRLRWFFSGLITLLVIEIIAGWVMVRESQGFSTREKPTAVERWITARLRSAALPAPAKERANPVPNTTEVLTEARDHWADHCASCHDNDGAGGTQIGQNLYPPAPNMRQESTQKKTDGELFYIIQNGIRMTGMPAWGSGSAKDDEDSWKLVRFIRHLPQLTFEEKKAMERLNPKGPEDLKEEQDEEKFLNGEDDHAPTTEHHHH